MDDFVCENISSDDLPIETPKIHITKKRLRRTQHLLLMPSNSPESHELREQPRGSRLKRTTKNLFLPKIVDIEENIISHKRTEGRQRDSLLKRKVALKAVQRKIEARSVKKKATKLKSHKKKLERSFGVTPYSLNRKTRDMSETPTSSRNNSKQEFIPKEAYINVVRLEFDSTISNGNVLESSSQDRNGTFTLNEKFYWPCFVHLERLNVKQLQDVSGRKSVSFRNNESIMGNFKPSLTSSPLAASTHLEIDINNSSVNCTPGSSPRSNGSSKRCSNSPINKHNGTYTIDTPNPTKITFRNSQSQLLSPCSSNLTPCSTSSKTVTSQCNVDCLNLLNRRNSAATPNSKKSKGTELQINRDLQSPKSAVKPNNKRINIIHQASANFTSFSTPTKIVNNSNLLNCASPIIPKSALKSNKKSSSIIRRRVTFSNTSIIFINDSDSISSEKVVGTPTPTIFSVSDSDEDEENQRLMCPAVRAGNTPFWSKKSPTKTLSNTKSSNVKKIPNFAAIHQKLFDKMLDIEEHRLKKEKRAKILCSARKPRVANLSQQKTPSTEDKSIKEPASNHKRIKKRPVNGANHKEIVASVANRKGPLKATQNNLKAEIKGVRTNRRFELLMKMRLTKK